MDDATPPGRINKHGAYICGPCVFGRHLGVNHGGSQYALCQCSCDGAHDKHGITRATAPGVSRG